MLCCFVVPLSLSLSLEWKTSHTPDPPLLFPSLPSSLPLFLFLFLFFYTQCLSTVEIIRASPILNQILPPEHIMTTKECAQVLSVLNTNAHMLEAGGSALFPEAGAM